MGGVYGSFLEAFPELMQPVEFFSQDPLVGAGYGVRIPIGTYEVILQAKSGSSIEGNSGRLSARNAWRTLDVANNDTMWAPDEYPLVQGCFMVHPNDGRIYRLATVLEYNREGGFKVWGITKLTGDTGSQDTLLPLIPGEV
jgi:hypothetical protein